MLRVSRITAVTDALTHSVTTSYDNWGRAYSVTIPAGTTVSSFDPDGNVLSVTDGNSHTTVNTFDNNCRLLTSTKANGDEMQYVYGGTGQKGLLSLPMAIATAFHTVITA